MATQQVTELKRAGVSTRGRQLWLVGSIVVVVVLAAVPLLTERQDLLNLLFLVYL